MWSVEHAVSTPNKTVFVCLKCSARLWLINMEKAQKRPKNRTLRNTSCKRPIARESSTHGNLPYVWLLDRIWSTEKKKRVASVELLFKKRKVCDQKPWTDQALQHQIKIGFLLKTAIPPISILKLLHINDLCGTQFMLADSWEDIFMHVWLMQSSRRPYDDRSLRNWLNIWFSLTYLH